MIKKYIKKENGVATSEAMLAVLIIILFSGLIATMSYNLYIANTSMKRMSKSMGYITDTFEYVDELYYDDVTKENIANYFNKKYYYQENTSNPKERAEVKIQENNENIDTPYKIYIKIENFNQMPGNEDKLDLVKQITITVNYKVGNREQIIELKRIKYRETIVTPNVPDFKLLTLQNGEKAYPIKNADENSTIWKVCSKEDQTWYNYEGNTPAIVLITTRELKINDQININKDERIYQWIPRYAINNLNQKTYLFSNTNKYVGNVDNYSKLIQISENYVVPEKFSQNGENLIGVWEIYSY